MRARDVSAVRRCAAIGAFGAAFVGAIVFAVQNAARAESATSAQAEHTAFPCDNPLTVEALAAVKAPKAAKHYRIELSIPALNNPYIQALIYGAQKASAESGVEISIDSGRGFMDPASQMTQLENALSRGPDALLINPADPNGMMLAIDEASATRPVIDVGTLSSSQKSYKVVQDDYTQGQMAADTVAKYVPNGGEGIVMGGPANATWARRRVAGFTDQIKKYPNIKVNEVTNQDIKPEEGVAKFANAAQAHPKVDWIYVVFSILLPPTSIPPEYKKAVYIGGGYDPVMIAGLKEGIVKAALPVFPVSVGYVGIAYAVKKLNGDDVPKRTCIPNAAVTQEMMNQPVWTEGNLTPEGWTPPR
jgi:ribose transport system substrate-binding protein